MKRAFLTLLSLAIAAAAIACQPPAGTPADAASSPQPNTAPASAMEPSNAASGAALQAAGLDFNLPEGWLQEIPENSMRAAQATIPGEGGPGQLTVFFFGPGGGGGVEPNIQRWIGQMDLDAGTESARESFSVGALQITFVTAQGTLKASTIGSFPTTDQLGYTLLGAVAEGAGGPWFFRAVGPLETMAQQRDNFLAMLHSARLQG